MLLEKTASPVVVAPPFIVSPVLVAPPPIVLEASEYKPPVNPIRVEVALATVAPKVVGVNGKI